jgi:heat shock protein HtpX
MRRRGVGRTPGLTARMAVALMLLAATYAAVWFGVYELLSVVPSWWPYWVVVSVALAFAMGRQYRNAGRTLLAVVGAELIEPGAEPALEGKVQRLASLADIPPPRLAIADTDAANAFALSLGWRKAVLVITRGLREHLTEQELEAALAHEIAHLANHDAAVMTAVAAPRILGQLIVGGDGESELNTVWVVIWPLGLPIYAVGALLTLTVSRYREFAADRGSAMLTGTPGELMSTLTKLSGQAAEIPHEDLRAANAFCIVSTHAQRFSLLSDHPPLEKRLAALAEIAREMGAPIS